MIRDWYSLGQLTLLPIAGTLALHLLLLAAILLRFQADSDPRTIEARVLPPTAINATLIDAASLKPKKQVRKQAPKPAAKAAPKPARKTPANTTAAASAKAPPKATSSPSKAPAVKPKVEPKIEERISAEELAAISRRELAAAMAAEDTTQVAVTAEEMSTSYAALIRDTVVNYWSRPPSARNGMEALLAIQLVPTGEIVSVSVIRSSGSVAFDRSAMNAVEKAGSFPELKNLPGREFEKTFRRFQLLFRPEDLRY
ncbi:cell envelope integrity protein TolA [Congregibacter variabilis]|uniref:Cell envelope integrity protein TolA n=1 Tax=Congregibacter variabilis TaxID=3081200 RepID=A0ABZ0HXK7_9GAMM|nr:cell envelope integrity protein TolA [Congregibacter sp. IMCC43200]